MSEKQDPLIGRTIACKYHIEEKIGQGGMGSVYRARHAVTGKLLALKVLFEDLAAYDSFVERFLHEARAAAHLTNPHIINIVDCGREGSVVYLLMEYLQGTTLRELIKREGPFTPGRASRILGQICSALADAHHHGIVHRDLKPENVILRQVEGERDYVKVLDFGIAKVLGEQGKGGGPTSKNMFIGTPEYASPEQCNSKPPTHLSDIYGLGVILFEMLAARPPFAGEPMSVMIQHASQAPPKLRDFGIAAGAEVEDVVARALRKEPRERYQSALQLAAEFQIAAHRQRRTTLEIPAIESAAGMRPPVQAASAEHKGALAARATLRTPYPTVSAQTSSGLRVVVMAFISIFILGGLLSAGYIGYQLYAWYYSTPPAPTPPGPPGVPVAGAVDALAGARLLFDQGNRDGAIQEVRRTLVASHGADPAAHTLLGMILCDQGDVEGAADKFKQALERSDGRFSEAHYQLGLLKLGQGDPSGAVREFQLASRDLSHIGAQVALAEIYLERGKRDEADRLLEPVLALTAEEPETVLHVGQALQLRKDHEGALRVIRRAIGMRGDSFPVGHYRLGVALLDAGRPDEAAMSLRRAIEQRAGNYPAARCVLGRVLYHLGDPQAALSELRAAVRLRGGNYPQAELALAMVLADPSVGTFQEADRILESAIRHRGGTYAEAREVQGTIAFFRYGRLEEARKAWTEADTSRARELLKWTADAFVLESSGEEVTSGIGDTAPLENSELSFEVGIWPAAGAAAVRLTHDDAGLYLQLHRDEGRTTILVASRVEAASVEIIETGISGEGFARSNSAKLSIRYQPGSFAYLINDRQVCRFNHRAGDPLRVAVRDARVILYHFQTTWNPRR